MSPKDKSLAMACIFMVTPIALTGEFLKKFAGDHDLFVTQKYASNRLATIGSSNPEGTTSKSQWDQERIRSDYRNRCHRLEKLILFVTALLLGHAVLTLAETLGQPVESTDKLTNQHLNSDEDFTFVRNGSFIQIDAGREWPFNSKREISFRFKTRSAHGLLIYQTFDHNRLVRDDEQDLAEPVVSKTDRLESKIPTTASRITFSQQKLSEESIDTYPKLDRRRSVRSSSTSGSSIHQLNLRHEPNSRSDSNSRPLAQLATNTITATASEKLVNSLFSTSNLAGSSSNPNLFRSQITGQSLTPRDKLAVAASMSVGGLTSRGTTIGARNRILDGLSSSGVPESADARLNFGVRGSVDNNEGPTIISSSAIGSLSASLYELYLKLENGRLKIVYEFGTRLNQTYCGKGLNDDRWHRIDLRVDPEINQMILVLDQSISVEIVLSQPTHEEDTTRRNELVFTNSVLYMGGLNNNASAVKNVRQRLYLAQFIGCIGNVLLRNDQNTESALQPAPIDRAVKVMRGCRNLCDTDNYCLHGSACMNFYTHTKCDCFGTNHEDTYCWQGNLTTLSMFGYSSLVYRIYDWRDRHHSNLIRFSIQFKTLALDSILLFAHGDLSTQQSTKNSINLHQQISNFSPFTVSTINMTNLPSIHRPYAHQFPVNSNYLAVSLSNGSLVVEINFGDQPILLSALLYERILNTRPDRYNKALNLSDGLWHTMTFNQNLRNISLQIDDLIYESTISGKNSHLYFDPSIYIGSIPNFLFNETKALARPLNLRHKYVGCLRSIYYNQHDILLALKQNSPMVEYRDILGKPNLNSCTISDPSSLPLTLRSGKSYLTFQLSSQASLKTDGPTTHSNLRLESTKGSVINDSITTSSSNRKLTWIEFEYKTLLQEHFLAGGHLRDLSYHDLGGFWTLHARMECKLYFTISSGLTFDPEQVLVLNPKSKSCLLGTWYKVTISIISGGRSLNITRTRANKDGDQPVESATEVEHGTYTLDSSVELLHQVQLGGDLAKFGETSSVPFSGCIRRIRINGNSFDSRDFVSSLSTSMQNPPIAAAIHQNLSSSTYGPIHHDVISNRMAQGYVTMDSCQLVNPCSALNPCKNGGVCRINELGDPDCDCSKTGYAGRRCHFSIYKRSCQDLFLSGQRKSSYYLIDLDRNGPLKPIRVLCNMESDQNQIETQLSHNLPAEYLIRRSSTNDIAFDITYLAFQHMYTHDGFYMHDDTDESLREYQNTMLRTLIGQSLYCRQYFRHECRAAPLFLGNRTWMEAPYPKSHRLTSLDGDKVGHCACASSDKKCLDPSRNCNCDSGEYIWSDDSVELSGHDQVGLTRIVMLRQDEKDRTTIVGSNPLGNVESQSRFTLSDLKCYGTKEHGNQHVITFKTSDAYIEVPGWRRGDISFKFRTASNPPAIVLYQLATSRNHGYFRLTLMTDTRLLFEFIINRKPRKLSLTAAHKLNNGEWQQVFIEYDSANLRLTVNDDSVFVDLDINDYLGTFEGPLFIGGAPSKYLVGELARRNGFTGCFKGLNINGRSIDLNDYLSPSMPTVISGCQPSCTKNLCQNGGKCIEYWGSYECECSNPIAHSGINCEINLNTNSITFVTPESHYMEQTSDTTVDPTYITKNILLNIRTYQESSLVLYAYDGANNFIQLHKNGTTLVLTFNSNNTIVVVQVPINDQSKSDIAISGSSAASTSTSSAHETVTVHSNSTHQHISTSNSSNTTSTKPTGLFNSLNGQHNHEFDRSIRVSNTSGSGQPIQIKIERHRLRTAFYVNNNFAVIDKPLMLLSNYSETPWVNPDLELVKPIRSRAISKSISKLYLANIDENFITRLPGFTGCIQGLSIDNQLFDFNRAHLTGELRGDFRIGCKMHCDSLPCKNQGTCIENWKEDKIQCKCEMTSYVGRLCDEDIAATFNGRTSHFIYNLQHKIEFKGSSLVETSSRPSSSMQTSNANLKELKDPQIIGGSSLIQGTAARSTDSINFIEVSLAFSTDSNQSMIEFRDAMQVLVLITRANSSNHFFLGLTMDGGLMIQEDYGNSMSLSRLIKRPDQPFNDGYRHMVKYSRLNQTIQIIVDHKTYLPTMSVITANQMTRLSKVSLLMIGTSPDSYQAYKNPSINRTGRSVAGYLDFDGCMSNLIVRIDNTIIEPLVEAFGQNLETINVTTADSIKKFIDTVQLNEPVDSSALDNIRTNLDQQSKSNLDEYSTITIDKHPDLVLTNRRLLNIVHKDSGQEVGENMETIMARDVEQGKCASFKKVENANEKRSVNEPKYTPMLDSKPVYMEPPRIKPYLRARANTIEKLELKGPSIVLFYLSITLLVILTVIVSIYAYILQVNYKSEKFKCETPFFRNKRKDADNSSGQRRK